ncbi:MAG: ribonuclease H-like domain-containing protein [Bacillota bacterium]|nr:ribonuclease H-like domain-containing protein [Bacillota bacterium]
MIINEYEINDIRDNHRLDEIYKESLFIDIETTGLSKIYSDIISITLLVYKDDKFRIYQIFCQYKSDQPQTLKYLKDLMKSKKYIITYNGNSFDIPFLAEKSKQFGTGLDFESLTKIDLYLLMKKLKYKINIVDLKLKTVEEYFCIERNDTIGGMDVVTLYEAYKLEPRKEFSDLILLHNYEDVNNLPLVMNNIFALYDDVIYLRNLIVTINYDGLSIKKDLIQCNFNVITAIDKDFINHSINYDMILSVDNQTLVINIPLHTYKDETIGEFYYLDNNEYELKTYTGLKGIKRNLIPIRINDKIYIDNIKSIVRKILEEGFGCSEKQVVTL